MFESISRSGGAEIFLSCKGGLSSLSPQVQAQPGDEDDDDNDDDDDDDDNDDVPCYSYNQDCTWNILTTSGTLSLEFTTFQVKTLRRHSKNISDYSCFLGGS